MSTMPKYIVSAMLQSADRSNAPVDQRWYTGDDLVQAIAAMVSAAARHKDVDAHVPASVRYSTLGVHLSIEQRIEQEVAPLKVRCNSHEGEHTFTDGSDGDTPCIGWRTEEEMVRADATPSTLQFDTESEHYSLSDCVYYDMPKRDLPKWAYGNCGGPRVGSVRVSNRGDTSIMCEKHFNAMP